MKKIRLILVLTFIISCLCLITACGSSALDVPSDLRFENNRELKWSSVSDARGYTIEVNGESYDTRRTSFNLASLQPGTYTAKVKARGNGSDSNDSDWASLTFNKEYESGLEFSLMKNGEYSVTSVGSAKGDIVIDDIYKGRPVSSIGERAFSGSSITSIVIGENIKSISDSAFYNCASLSKVGFSDGILYIGKKAFQSCYNITSVSLPDSILVIEDSAFEFCRGLSELVIGTGVISIGNNAFKSCNIKSVILPSTLNHLGEMAFAYNEELESSVINGNNLTVGSQAFYNCKTLSNLNINRGVVSIENRAFLDCIALESVKIPDGIVSIGDYAFVGCSSLSNIEIGSDVEQIGTNAFSGTEAWSEAANIVIIDKWIVEVKDKSILQVDLYDSDIVGISTGAFMNCNQLTGIMLPRSLVYLNPYAFYSCENLISVAIDDNVLVVERSAFALCKNLRNVVLGNSITEIGAYAFYQCENLTSNTINMPESVVSIGSSAFADSAVFNDREMVYYIGNWVVGSNESAFGIVDIRDNTLGIADNAFYNRTGISAVNLPNTVKYIGSSAFGKCSNLTGFTFPDGIETISTAVLYGAGIKVIDIPFGVKSIGVLAFGDCSNLEEVVIPDTVTDIGDFAFYYDWELVDLTIGENVFSIGSYAFSNCESLTSVKLPDSLRTLGDHAFYRCYKLYDLDLGNGVGTIGERAFYQCKALPSLVLPDSVTSIGDYAFYKCTNLATVRIGSRVDNIGSYAFYKCTKLMVVDIPESVTTIGDFAFRGCIDLRSVALGGSVTSIGEHAFYGCEQTTIYSEAGGTYYGWNDKWNSSYRPIVWNCVLSDDKSYVESLTVTENGISNFDATLGISEPVRKGYVFIGWSQSADGSSIDYKASQLTNVPVGTTLYSVWREKTADELAAEKPEAPEDLNVSVFG